MRTISTRCGGFIHAVENQVPRVMKNPAVTRTGSDRRSAHGKVRELKNGIHQPKAETFGGSRTLGRQESHRSFQILIRLLV